MRRRRPHIIGIAGATCSGKSQLARRLKDRLDDRKPIIISTDSYYRDLSARTKEEREKHNFDVPDAIEFELLAEQLKTLAEGEDINRPIYNFSTHTRETDSILVSPSDLIIVEGLFVLHWEDLRELMDTKIFVNISHDAALKRRLERDIVERGRSRQSIMDQYETTVRPMAERFVLPTSSFADILINGEEPMDQIANDIVDRIQLPDFYQ